MSFRGGVVATALGAVSTTIPLFMVLNTFGGIVAVVWLALLGDWGTILLGLVVVLVSSWVISLLLLPGMLIGLPGMMLYEKGRKTLARIPLALSSLYTTAVMLVWAIFVLDFALGRAAESSLYPYLLWSYGVAAGPWGYLASKEDNEFSVLSTFFLQIAYLSACVIIAVLGVSSASVVLVVFVMGAVMFTEWILSLSIASELEREATIP